MKSSIRAFLLVVLLGFISTSEAGLVDYGNGMIYDTDLGITWLQDANYAKTSGYDADGKMTWEQANLWVAGLNFGGYEDWRLPNLMPVNGSSYNGSVAYDGSSDVGFNISAPGSTYPGSTSSEMAYMYYNNLGNKGRYDVNHVFQSDFGLNNIGPFLNLQAKDYWSGMEENRPYFWEFYFYDGFQGVSAQTNELYAWAVRDGAPTNVPVPEPSALLMSALSLLGAGGYVRRRFFSKH